MSCTSPAAVRFVSVPHAWHYPASPGTVDAPRSCSLRAWRGISTIEGDQAHEKNVAVVGNHRQRSKGHARRQLR
jgi:hypothetical protein